MRVMPITVLPLFAFMLISIVFRDWPSACGLTVSLIAYSWEIREIRIRNAHSVTWDKLAEIEVKVSILEAQITRIHETSEATMKQAEQVQKLISNSNLASAFSRK